MAKLLSAGGREICVLTGFQTAAPVGPRGVAFAATTSFDDAMSLHQHHDLMIEHAGVRYNAMIKQARCVTRDGMSLATVNGMVWPL